MIVEEQNTLYEDLERFVFDNPELERLEAILDDFNPFVALGWTRQEIRHSSCLRWLLDPRETHRLGAYFLRAFLKRLARSSTSIQSPSVINVDSWDYQMTDVLQEWNGIDIFIRDDENGFVAVVENKIDSQEHGRQLQRYRDLVEKQFPNHRKLYAYLTVDGIAPSDDAYTPIDYGEIIDLVKDTLNRRGDQLSPEVKTFLGHYLEMLRRHIVEDSEIQDICSKIYRKHRRALDVLFEHRPDRISMVSEYLQNLVETNDKLILDHCSKANVRFIPKSMDFMQKLGEGWTRSKRLVLFTFHTSGHLQLIIGLGPGDKRARNSIHEYISKYPGVFNRANQKLYPMWWTFHSERWINQKQFADLEVEDLKTDISKKFDRFINEELTKVLETFEGLRDLQLEW